MLQHIEINYNLTDDIFKQNLNRIVKKYMHFYIEVIEIALSFFVFDVDTEKSIREVSETEICYLQQIAKAPKEIIILFECIHIVFLDIHSFSNAVIDFLITNTTFKKDIQNQLLECNEKCTDIKLPEEYIYLLAKELSNKLFILSIKLLMEHNFSKILKNTKKRLYKSSLKAH